MIRKMDNGKWTVSAYYEFTGVGDMRVRDEAAASAAASAVIGSGCGGGIRDVQFVFDTEFEASAARDELLLSGFMVEHPEVC